MDCTVLDNGQVVDLEAMKNRVRKRFGSNPGATNSKGSFSSGEKSYGFLFRTSFCFMEDYPYVHHLAMLVSTEARWNQNAPLKDVTDADRQGRVEMSHS